MIKLKISSVVTLYGKVSQKEQVKLTEKVNNMTLFICLEVESQNSSQTKLTYFSSVISVSPALAVSDLCFLSSRPVRSRHPPGRSEG